MNFVCVALLVGFYRTILTLSMRALGPRISAYAFWTTTDIHTYRPTYIYISREISIEHPSVGLASLAQLIGSGVRSSSPLRVIGRAKRAPHWGVQSRFHVIYVFIARYLGNSAHCSELYI